MNIPEKNQQTNFLIARVSDEDQRQALPAQELRLKQYAKTKEWTTFNYCEFDESAYKGQRKLFSEEVEKIKKTPGLCIVVFDKIDRFTRDSSQSVVQAMAKMVDSGHIEMHFPSDNLFIKQDSPATDKFRLGIGMLLGKYYSDSSRDNVKRRFAQMLNDEIWPHKAPFGYKNVQYENPRNRKRPVKVS